MKEILRLLSSWNTSVAYFNRTILASLAVFLLIILSPLIVAGFTLTDLDLNTINIAFSGRQALLLGKSIALAVGAASFAIILGLPIGIGLWDNSTVVYRFRGVILSALLLPPFIFTQGWMALAMSPPPGMPSLQPPTGIFWAMLILGTAFSPLSALILGAARYFLPVIPIESATFHAQSGGLLKSIVLPILLPFIGSAWLIIATLVLLEGGVPLMLQLPVYATEITSRFLAGESAGRVMFSMWPLPLLAIVSGFIGLRLVLFRKSMAISENSNCNHPSLNPHRMSVTVKYLIYAGWTIFCVFIGLPLLGLMRQSISEKFTLISLGSDIDAFLWSLFIAVIAALISTIISFPLGAFMAVKRRHFLMSILCISLIIPASVIGMSWATIGAQLNAKIPFMPESFSIILGHIARLLPFSLVIIILGRKRFSRSNARDSVLFYKPNLRQRLALELPIISLSFFSSVVLSMRELEVSILTIPPGGQTLPIRVFNLLHYGASADVCRLSLLLAIFLAIITNLLMRRCK